MFSLVSSKFLAMRNISLYSVLLKLQMYRKSGALHKDFNFIVKRTCYNLRTNDKLQGTMVLGWFNLCKHFAYLCHCFSIECMYYCENISCAFIMMYVLFLSHVEKFCTQWITRKKEKKKEFRAINALKAFRLHSGFSENGWKWQ